MSILPTVQDDPRGSPSPRTMAVHRQRLVRMIDETAEWRREKNEEYQANVVATRRGRRCVAALDALAEYVEGLPDDDPTLQLTFRAYYDPGESANTYKPWGAGGKILCRYGLGLAVDPADADHDRLLRDLASVEIQQRSATDAQRTERLTAEVYSRVRKLRAIQERNSDLSVLIEECLTAIWNGTYDQETKA